MIDLYLREYARLLGERAQVDPTQGIDSEDDVRMKNLQSKMRRRELERFIAEQVASGSDPDDNNAPAPFQLRNLVQMGISTIKRAFNIEKTGMNRPSQGRNLMDSSSYLYPKLTPASLDLIRNKLSPGGTVRC
jgi:hypothetical protein